MRHMSEPAALDRRNAIVVIILAVCAASIGAAAETAPVQTTEFTFEDLKLKVPAGFTVTRVAGPPLVDRPVSVSFDENGGLYVADSSGSNKPLREQQDDPQHKVLRLEDTDGDGVFDRRTVFADKLMMLQGTQWYRGSLYVAAPPKIWKLTDTNNDGVADERVEWFDGKVPLSCGNDVHGPSIGRDGRLYWCKGEFSPQVHDLPGRPGWKSKAAHVFRARPDGTDREMVMTGGMNNPVELAFTPSGERILSATFISNDMGGGRDGLIHAIYGGVYGREHGVLDGHERTGDLLSPMLSMGAAAPCGTQLLVSRSLGDDLAGNLFVCAFNLRTVFRNVLTSTNGTFTTVSTPFVTGDSSDFHPTDVHEDADGSLLVIDTGGWYKICCPTSRVEKPQVLGAIYRIRRAGAEPVKDPRGLALDWPTIAPLQLAHLLADARPAVAERAGDALACIGVRAVDAIKQFLIDSPSPAARQNAVWALSKIDGPEARTVIRMALTDKAAEVRHAASHVAGLHRDAEAVGALAAVLAGDDAGSSRAAAEAIGRLASVAGVQAVLAAMPKAMSRSLEHSFIYALIEAARPEPLLAALDSPHPQVVRAAIYSLDQMASRLTAPVLSRDRLLPLCGSIEPLVRDAAWWVVSQHPDWAESLAGSLQAQLKRAATSGPEEADGIIAMVARLTVRPAAAAAIAAVYTESHGAETAAMRRAALAVMRTARPAATPKSWFDPLAAMLAAGTDQASVDEMSAALKTLAGLSLDPVQRAAIRPTALAIATAPSSPPRACALALQVAGAADAPLPPTLADRLIGMLSAGDAAGVSPLDRSAAAAALAASTLDDACLGQIASSLATLLGNDASTLLPAFTRRGSGLLVAAVEAISRGAKPESIDRATVAAAVAALPAESRHTGQKLLDRIDAARAAERQTYATLAASLPDGDAARGKTVFASNKAACTACHAMTGIGGRIGPDLTTIGAIRMPSDLLEAIVLPSVAFVRTYEPVAIVTDDGRAFSGIIRDETATDIVVQTSATATERIARSNIESLELGTVSLMPKGYDSLLSLQELADLVAYLSHSQ